MHQATVFGFREWPFRVVVDEDFARIWADRSQLRAEIDRRVEILQALPHSTVQLIWADFGAGKSHTLRYLETRCKALASRTLIPLYVEVPPNLGGLQALFHRLTTAFPEELLIALGETVIRQPKAATGSIGARDLRQALRLFASTDATGREVARDWLSAVSGTPNLRLLRSYGISSRIDDDARIGEILVELVRCLRGHTPGSAIVWLVDEYQRLAEMTPKKRDAISQALVSLFNACPVGLHLILSLSVAQQSAAAALLPQALRSRASTFPLLTLPFLSKDDAVHFVRDLTTAFRLPGCPGDVYPFTQAALTAVLNSAESKSSEGLTPRSLMEVLSQLLLDIYATTDGQPRLPLSVADCAPALSRLSLAIAST